MSSITLEHPATKPQTADEVEQTQAHDDWLDSQRSHDRLDTDYDGVDRAEHSERSYDHGDAPPGVEPDGTVDVEYANPT